MKLLYSKKLYTNKLKGSALIYVIFVFTFVTLSSVVLYHYFRNNIQQASRQQKTLQAHFIALSGSELAINALLQEQILPDGKKTKLLDEFKKDPNKGSLTQALTINDGTVDITVGFMQTPADALDQTSVWVQVVSVGKLRFYNGDIISSTSMIDINATDPRVIRWH